MSDPEDQNKKHAFPSWVLGLVLLAAITGAIFLLPKKGTLLERQLKDKDFERAKKTLSTIPPEERSRRVEFYAGAELQILSNTESTDEELINGIKLGARSSLPGVTNLVRRLRSPSDAYASIKVDLENLPPSLRHTIYSTLISSLLAQNKPSEAALIYEDFSINATNPAIAMEQIDLWRGAGQAGRALQFLEKYKSKNPGIPYNLKFAELNLLRETSQSEKAFTAALALFKSSPQVEKDTLLPLISRLALEAGRGGELLPILEEQVKTKSGDVELWQRVAELALSGGSNSLAISARQAIASLQPSNLTNLQQLAQLHEWNSEPEQAFDAYLRAFMAGSDSPIRDLLRLNNALYKDLELVSVFSTNGNRLINGGFGLELARMFSGAAEYAKAEEIYRKLNPEKNRDVALELAVMLQNNYEYPKVIAFLDSNPHLLATNLMAKEIQADALSRLGRNAEAFKVLKEISLVTTNSGQLRRFLTLAESLGKMDDLVSMLKLMTEREEFATSDAFRSLAYFQTSLGRKKDALDSFRAGVEKFPADSPLRLQYAIALIEVGDFLRASAVLKTHPELKTSPSVAGAYVSALIQSQNFTEADRFFRREIDLAKFPELAEASAQLAETMRDHKRAASLYEQLTRQNPGVPRHAMNHARMVANLGQPKVAIRLIQPYLKDSTDPALAKLAAEVYSAAGEYRTAEKYQKLYLASNPEELPQAWGFLGDLRLSRGDKTNARRAYERGLNELLQRQQSQ